MLVGPTKDYPWRTIAINGDALKSLHRRMVLPGDQYGTRAGNKIDLDTTPEEARGQLVDCSGYVRWLVYQCSGVAIPDGSVVQKEWVEGRNFKRSSPAACALRDGIIRIAFLAPREGKMGHVALVLEGSTVESHFRTGPDSRDVSGLVWLERCSVFAVTKK